MQIKVIVHGVRGWVALMEDSKIELFWPPHVAGNSRRWSIRTVDDGALIDIMSPYLVWLFADLSMLLVGVAQQHMSRETPPMLTMVRSY